MTRYKRHLYPHNNTKQTLRPSTERTPSWKFWENHDLMKICKHSVNLVSTSAFKVYVAFSEKSCFFGVFCTSLEIFLEICQRRLEIVQTSPSSSKTGFCATQDEVSTTGSLTTCDDCGSSESEAEYTGVCRSVSSSPSSVRLTLVCRNQADTSLLRQLDTQSIEIQITRYFFT